VPNFHLKFDIIFENEDFVIINKPAGIQVHPSAVEKEATVSNWALAHYPEIIDVHDSSTEAAMRPGIVHRLDKDTSGVMVIAKNIKTLLELKKLFSERKVSKTYSALVYGKVENETGRIDAPISRSASHKKQVAAARRTTQKIREAVTEYSVAKRFNNFTLLDVHPLTGRMHQIRVHCLHIGHPIVGDAKYNKQEFNLRTAPSRQLLHARSISFELFNEKYTFQAPLAEDFKTFLANID
jgi:23S rRNA pseudouridine1911/1915/1917 synthase